MASPTFSDGNSRALTDRQEELPKGIKNRGKRHTQKINHPLVISGKLDAALGIFDPNVSTPPETLVCVHYSDKRLCAIKEEYYLAWLIAGLAHAELGYPHQAYDVGGRGSADPDKRIVRKEVLSLCQCIHCDDTCNTDPCKRTACLKLTCAENLGWLKRLTPLDAQQYTEEVNCKKAMLYVEMYGKMVIDTCAQCSTHNINWTYVDASETQCHYCPDTKAFCTACNAELRRMHQPSSMLAEMLAEMLAYAVDDTERAEVRQTYKQCPACDVVIHHVRGGGAVVRCLFCETKFCWTCMAYLNPRYPYDHICGEVGVRILPRPNVKPLQGIPFGGKRAPRAI
jgi:hypothetical protein